MKDAFLKKTQNKTLKISIIGLGYVGFPLLELFHKKGFNVNGFDLDKKKVDIATKKRGYNASNKPTNALKNCDCFIICVPTPVDKNHKPDLSFVKDACKSIIKNLRKNNLVILESTVSPGTTEEVLIPTLEKSGLKAGKDFFVAHCPERIDPGNKKWKVQNIPRVIGGINQTSTELTYKLYNRILDAEITKLSSLKNAEATKIVENTFRDINIAFVNELAKSFDKIGIDIKEVINAASTKPFGFMAHYPGCGVGGHCIAVDPYYLIEKAKKIGFNHNFLKLARKINNSMPTYTVGKIIKGLKQVNIPLKNSNISILGLAYKGGTDDTRESPAFPIIEKLKDLKAKITIYDPYVPSQSTSKNLEEALDKKDCVVIVTDHKEFKEITAEKLKGKNVKVLIDGRNILNKKEIKDKGIIYEGIGR